MNKPSSKNDLNLHDGSRDGQAQGKMLNISGPTNAGLIDVQGNQAGANQSIITQVKEYQDGLNGTAENRKEKKKKKKDRGGSAERKQAKKSGDHGSK